MGKDNVIVNMVIDKIRFQQIGPERYLYDANGNPTLVTNDSLNTTRELYWDEENRLMVLSDNGKTSRYTYNHAGERIVKSHGDLEGVYINGAPQGITFHENDEFTLYPASIISVNKNRFTKHYFIGSQRIASRIGSGRFNNVYGRNGSYVTAGQQDYAERLNQIQQQREEYYKELGIPPGVPTMKGAYGDPENTGVGYNTIITDLGDHSIPANWAQYVVKREPGETPGPPIIWSDPQNPDEVEAGYGYIEESADESEELFYYHSDHLGSTSYITDDKGNITQYIAYLPYGELLVDEHSSSEDLPYKFNGKELDDETGLYYYGARYLQPMSGIFLNPDRFTAKYPNLSAYNYCAGNPIKYIDVNGDSVRIIFNKDKMELHMLDMDNYNSKKGLNYVSYENYKEGQENQVLVIPFVFSGGEVNDDGVVVINPEKKHIQRALPNGVYDILDNTSDTNPIHSTWYRLDRKDKSRYDDRDDYTKRSGFRLHLGLESHGCVTINRDQNNSKEMWNVLNDIMNKTSTKQVKENRGRQWLNPFSKRKWYGTMVVIGND